MTNKIRVLCVDDDTSLNQLLEKVLLESGYHVDLATDGLSALSKLKEQYYDIAILDNYLPTMNGIDILKHIRAHNFPTKVIMITAVNEHDLVQEGLKHGADEILTKPFEFEKLIDCINQRCGMK
jgi:DNA-binding response OmpR family regulator